MELPDNFGDKVGSLHWTFGRSEQSPNSTNVSQQVNCSEIDAVKPATEYGVRMAARGSKGRPFTEPVTFTVQTNSDQPRFTTPLSYVEDCNIKPGHTVSFVLYEIQEDQTDLSDVAETDQLSEEEMYGILNSAMSNLGKAQAQIQTVRDALDVPNDD